MKTILLITALLPVLSQSLMAEDVHRAKIVKLTSEIQQTPQFQVSGPKNKSVKPRFWLEIEAEIEVETKSKSQFIPELEAQWFAVIYDKFSKSKKEPVRLTGKCSFKNVRTTGKTIFISAYIDPDTLERLTGKARPSDRDIEGFALKLSGTGIISTGRYANDLVMATAEQKSKWWETWAKKSMPAAILPKSKTPFAPLWTDRYPTEKGEQ